MRRSAETPVRALLAVIGLAGSALAAPAPPTLARLSFVERRVERSSARGWQDAREGGGLLLGEAVRTTADAMARLELPWMTITLGPGSAVRFPDDYLLSAVLEQGRVQLRGDKRDMLKLVTSEAVVRGRGWAVVRRQGGATAVAALAGRFMVEGGGKTVALEPGTGTVVREGRAPAAPAALADPPHGLSPGADPRYVALGDAVSLSGTTAAAEHQIEVLAVGSEEVLLQRDVGPPPWRLVIPWPGAFRWRVSARDARGLEGKPSADGFIVVDE